jgi:hypothetical protein
VLELRQSFAEINEGGDQLKKRYEAFGGLRVLQLGSGLALALAAGLLVVSQASADSVSVSRVTIAPGSQGSVTLSALDIGAPGLGAWSIDVVYDPSAVSVVGCTPQAGSICNTGYAANTVRVVGATSSGNVGDTVLATITFSCDGEGSSGLKVVAEEFADATEGSPRDIAAAEVDGGVTCTEQEGGQDVPGRPPSGSDDEEPTATPVITTLPEAGSGGGAASSMSWAIGALAAAGLAGLGLSTALRARAKQ